MYNITVCVKSLDGFSHMSDNLNYALQNITLYTMQKRPLGEKTEVYTLKSGLSLSPRVSIPKILILLRFFLFIYRSQLFPSLIPSFPHFLSPSPRGKPGALAVPTSAVPGTRAVRGYLSFAVLKEHGTPA